MPRGASDIDYYEVLGVDPDASDDDLRRAWKQLALKWHPDRAGSAGTEFIFRRIADAYAVLCDPMHAGPTIGSGRVARVLPRPPSQHRLRRRCRGGHRVSC